MNINERISIPLNHAQRMILILVGSHDVAILFEEIRSRRGELGSLKIERDEGTNVF